jgi:hypothetical protein
VIEEQFILHREYFFKLDHSERLCVKKSNFRNYLKGQKDDFFFPVTFSAITLHGEPAYERTDQKNSRNSDLNVLIRLVYVFS